MHRYVLMLLGALALSGCQTTAGPPMEATELYVPKDRDNAALARAFSRLLRDPASADYPVIYARQGASGTIYYCGVVNSRNGFGGYTGATPFYGVGNADRVAIISLGDTPGEAQAALNLCRQAGFPNPLR